MDFDYKALGKALAWNRIRRNLRQTDIEERSDFHLKQPAISAAEHGETRLSVDTLVQYCNALNIRADTVLDPFLTTRQEEEDSDAIIDPYVIQLAKLMSECSPKTKLAILQMARIIKSLQ